MQNDIIFGTLLVNLNPFFFFFLVSLQNIVADILEDPFLSIFQRDRKNRIKLHVSAGVTQYLALSLLKGPKRLA
jgi:hypothetical protein